jgi:hypothetical protein
MTSMSQGVPRTYIKSAVDMDLKSFNKLPEK